MRSQAERRHEMLVNQAPTGCGGRHPPAPDAHRAFAPRHHDHRERGPDGIADVELLRREQRQCASSRVARREPPSGIRAGKGPPHPGCELLTQPATRADTRMYTSSARVVPPNLSPMKPPDEDERGRGDHHRDTVAPPGADVAHRDEHRRRPAGVPGGDVPCHDEADQRHADGDCDAQKEQDRDFARVDRVKAAIPGEAHPHERS